MNQHDKTQHSHDECANRPKEETAQQHSPEVKHIEHVELLPKHDNSQHLANENQQFFDELTKLADPALNEYSEEEKELIRKATAEIPMPAWPKFTKKTASFGQLAGGGRTHLAAPALPKPVLTPEEISRNNLQLIDNEIVIGFDKGCGADSTATTTVRIHNDGSVSIVGDVTITGNVNACNGETNSAGQIEHDSSGQAETDSAGQIEYDSAGQAEFDSSGESESM